MRVLVTGIYGFIGSYFARYLSSMDPSVHIVGFGRDTDQSNRDRLRSRCEIVHGDLRDVSGLCEDVDVVVNFAAKTFVDHSLKDRRPFIESNILGADALMEDATKYGVKCFVQISTDEVYGEILEGAYKEDATLQPRNPYAWSKACADLNAVQRHRTYGFPVIITRTENNFGPYQHRQKAIPTFVRTALLDQNIPVYGDGMHVRCWLHVEEHCRAIWHLVRIGLTDSSHFGQVYHVAGEEELTNKDLAVWILGMLRKPTTRIRYVPDHNIRPGHDRRYALNCDKLKATGFSFKHNLSERMEETVMWYASAGVS